jgi:hypothetical protein
VGPVYGCIVHPNALHLPLHFLHCRWAPPNRKKLLLPCCCDFPSAEHDFSTENKWKMEKGSNGDEKLQIIYRWKALGEENILEQFIFGFIHCASLASEEKGIRA